MIVNVSNFTISHCVNQLAVLECIITNREIGLLVWVNWTTSTGECSCTPHPKTATCSTCWSTMRLLETMCVTCFQLTHPKTPELLPLTLDQVKLLIELQYLHHYWNFAGTSCPICALGSKSQNGMPELL